MSPGVMNAPLWFTFARIAAIPPLMVLLLVDDVPGGRWWAFGVFVAACITDSIDGWLARSRGLVTVMGAFLDPLADKLLISAVLVCLVETGEVAAWAAMVIIAREFAVTGLRLVAAAEDVIMSAGRLGKAKAFSQNVALAVIMLDTVATGIEDTLLYIALALTVISGAHYFIVARWRLFSGTAGKKASPDAVSEP
ncbi:MAG TPA: CDP-diacylglycerol--glycerol-3-phosphate 3-phosphatidyltransferase [Miltoncostaeaceae bacterium]|nr:CDP-diacylglycerol--glycerol-3-phosphate 3-phosphatidyltransferase [Miltoncostaeaceae bacterium]